MLALEAIHQLDVLLLCLRGSGALGLPLVVALLLGLALYTHLYQHDCSSPNLSVPGEADGHLQQGQAYQASQAPGRAQA